MRRFLRQFKTKLLKLDRYGHPINVHFRGESTYKTWFGLMFTMLIDGFMVKTMIVLATAFFDHSRQEELVNVLKYDRYDSGPYNLAENQIKFYIFPYLSEDVFDDDDD